MRTRVTWLCLALVFSLGVSTLAPPGGEPAAEATTCPLGTIEFTVVGEVTVEPAGGQPHQPAYGAEISSPVEQAGEQITVVGLGPGGDGRGKGKLSDIVRACKLILRMQKLNPDARKSQLFYYQMLVSEVLQAHFVGKPLNLLLVCVAKAMEILMKED